MFQICSFICLYVLYAMEMKIANRNRKNILDVYLCLQFIECAHMLCAAAHY